MNIESVIFLLIVGIFGLILGSFLNVVIYRLPRKESLIFPASHCPVCSTPIKYSDNIPILSYIILGGRCRSCYAKISWIYPFVEFITAIMVVVLFLINGFTINFVADCSLGLILLVAAIIDSKHMIIPDRLNYTGAVIAIIFSLWRGFDGIARSFGGAFFGFFILAILYWVGKLLFKREGVGLGDMKLAIVIGLFVGPFWCLMALLFAVLIGGIWGITQIITGNKKIGMQVPFGPFIALGGFLVLFFRIQILYFVEQYLSML